MFKGFIVMALEASKPLITKSFKKGEFLPYVLHLVDQMIAIFTLMTDDNKDNSAQLKVFMIDNAENVGKHAGQVIKDLLDEDDKSSFKIRKIDRTSA